MKKTVNSKCVVLLGVAAMFAGSAFAGALETLCGNFRNPPEKARIQAWWHWIGDNADKDRFVVPIWVDLYVTVGMFRADDRETVIDGEDSHDNQGEITEARDQEIAASGGLSGVLAEAEGESDTGSGEACEEEGYGEDAERVNFSFGMVKEVAEDDAPRDARDGGDELP